MYAFEQLNNLIPFDFKFQKADLCVVSIQTDHILWEKCNELKYRLSSATSG